MHVNGLVETKAGARMWIARRSPGKAIDPGLLDNLVGGGIAAGAGVAPTLVKEAWEEAGIDAPRAPRRDAGRHRAHLPRRSPTACSARRSSSTTCCFPPDFRPAGQDGEVVGHRLVPLDEAARLVAPRRGPDVVTADASLVIVDCLLRRGLLAPDLPDYFALEALRHPPLRPAARGRRPYAAACAGAGDTWRMPISASVSRTALTACRISSGPIAPMHPTRKVSTCVSLPG